ncbi:MAG: hypothetical protein ACI9ND_002980, partial [Yoonia sp.]
THGWMASQTAHVACGRHADQDGKILSYRSNFFQSWVNFPV